MDMTKLNEIRERHSARADDGWITINGTHVMTDKEGNLTGKVGGKISSESSSGGKKAGSSAKSPPKKGPHGGKLSQVYKSGTVEYTGAHYEDKELSENTYAAMSNAIKKDFVERHGKELGISGSDIDYDDKTGRITAWCKPSSLKLGKEEKQRIKSMGVKAVKAFYQTKPYAKSYQVRPSGKIHPMGIDYDFELKGVKY